MEWTTESFLGWQINDMNDMNDIYWYFWISWIWILSTLRFTKWVPGGWRDGEGCFDSERQAGVKWTGLDSIHSATWIEFNEFEAESESWKGKTHHAEATTTATGEGAALGTIPNRKDLSKISSINFSQRCDHLFFCSNESTVCDSGCTVAALENFQEL